MNNEIVFGVNILEHLQKQLNEKDLTVEQRKDLTGLIKHLESGKSYHEYQHKNN